MSAVLIRAIERYCDENRVAVTTFGRAAVNDPRLIGDLRAGRSITDRRTARIVAFMDGEHMQPALPPTPAVPTPVQRPALVQSPRPAQRKRQSTRYVHRTDDPHPVLGDIARFLRDSRMAESTFGYRAIGDPNIVEDIRCGRDIRRATERRLRAFMMEKRMGAAASKC